MKGIKKGIPMLLLVMCMAFLVPIHVKASSGVIQFTTASSQVKKGDTFTVVCQITSSDSFLDSEFRITYDDAILTFVKGGKKVSGSAGNLKVSSTGNSTAVTKRTFSLQFTAVKNGNVQIGVDGTAKVTDADGNAFSVSSNKLTVNVSKHGADTAPVKATPTPLITPVPAKSANNKLKTLATTALSMSPEFASDTTEYTATVDCNTQTLFVTFTAADAKSRVELQGNDNLQIGQNQAKIIVTAENGSRKEYHIAVTKETQSETKEREQKENGDTKDVSFRIVKDGNRIVISNSYEFEVLDVSNLSSIPAGYIQSTIELNGISVPAFTMENDLDNNYLLLYLKGPSGASSIYQYDRTEQTLQKYTGSMIDKVNKSAGQTVQTTSTPISNYVLFGIIIGLVIIILCMMIAMLKMAMKRKELMKQVKKEKNVLDDLDF